jgi:hypothetical protein
MRTWLKFFETGSVEPGLGKGSARRRRPAADVDQCEALEKTTIVELLRYAQWGVDSHVIG